MNDRADIIVVGAGPAGATAAKLLCDRGYFVLLVDRANFPRHKTCASWINRLAFERFSYLQPHLDELIEAPFYGIKFFDATVERDGEYLEPRPCGYLSLRSKFDDGLRKIAMEAGAQFIGGCAVTGIRQERETVTAILADGRELTARVLIGADGASSRVAIAAGVRKAWSRNDYVLCANADVPCSTELIAKNYGNRFPFYVYLEYRGIRGYAWVFPKRRHVCVGIGAMLGDGREIRGLYSRFFGEMKQRGHLPSALPETGTYYDIDPVGAVHRLETLTRGRVMLIGDAAGFVSGSTGEGIYPGMVSAEVAAGVVQEALAAGSIESGLAKFNAAWRRELGEYVKRLPGGEQEGKTRGRIDLIFRSSIVSRMAGRIFLYGEKPSLGNLARALWPPG
ncbi:MAG TPA: NAD(P)/FAD-dependent oxidoreductase [Terriglobia bacterium]|nr:NAD(P)/FAD-dependent oxidoreductase [Terriglobia bacterium]